MVMLSAGAHGNQLLGLSARRAYSQISGRDRKGIVSYSVRESGMQDRNQEYEVFAERN